jgi:hypothetical protein
VVDQARSTGLGTSPTLLRPAGQGSSLLGSDREFVDLSRVQETVEAIEKLADELNKQRVPSAFKKAIVKGIPREAVLLPAHAQYRLQTQSFSLGDRVTMVQNQAAFHSLLRVLLSR